jgi:hypothetical protein
MQTKRNHYLKNNYNKSVPKPRHIKVGHQIYLGTALANDDGAGLGDLIAVDLDAESFATGVAPVLGTSGSFLVCVLDSQRESPWERQGWLGTRHAYGT